MNRAPPTVFFLPGAGGGRPDWSNDAAFLALGASFKGREEDSIRFERIQYPDWRRWVDGGFSVEVIISELVEEIVAKAPDGRVWIVGFSIGGHFGYASALRLQAIGREIAGFCAIDTFMISSSEPKPGWKKRHLEEALRLLHNGRFHELALFLRKRFWRAQLRLLLATAPALLRILARSDRAPALAALDPVLEHELNMRVLMRGVAPWIGSLDRDPVAINAPVALLRTRKTAGDDSAWRRRCPNIEIIEIDGDHSTLLDPENAGSFRKAFEAATHNWRLGIGE
jgi:thioesterase domain-containing protein